jgi:hypothetical protein
MAAREACSSKLRGGLHLIICLKVEEKQEICVEIAGRRTFRIYTGF